MTDRAKKKDQKWLAVALAVVAAAALGYACFSKRWLYNPRTVGHEQVGFGLLANQTCIDHGDGQGPQCVEMSNSELIVAWKKELAEAREHAQRSPDDVSLQAFAINAAETYKTSGAFVPLGWITLIACALAAASLAICVLLVLGGRRVTWPIMPTTTAILGLAVALISGCVFAATKPGAAGFVGVNRGFFAYGAGVVVGIAAALMLNKLLRPHDEDPLAEPMDPEHY